MTNFTFIGLDVHKNSADFAIADDSRAGEVRAYGKIGGDLSRLDLLESPASSLRPVPPTGRSRQAGASGGNCHCQGDGGVLVGNRTRSYLLKQFADRNRTIRRLAFKR